VKESKVATERITLGELRGARKCLHLLIWLRFPEAMTPEVERAIAEETNRDVLCEWLLAAVAAKTAEEILALLCVPSVVTHANGEAPPCSMP
jgi:hypothetical protein